MADPALTLWLIVGGSGLDVRLWTITGHDGSRALFCPTEILFD